MKTFKVLVQIQNRELEYRINCSSFATASQRAIKLARKEFGRKKLKEINLRILYLGPVEESSKDVWPSESDIATAPDFVPQV